MFVRLLLAQKLLNVLTASPLRISGVNDLNYNIRRVHHFVPENKILIPNIILRDFHTD
jgi:hypothetical protein